MRTPSEYARVMLPAYLSANWRRNQIALGLEDPSSVIRIIFELGRRYEADRVASEVKS